MVSCTCLRTPLLGLACIREQNHGFADETCSRAEQPPWFADDALRASERELWCGNHACARAGTATMVRCNTLCAMTHSKCGLVRTDTGTLSSHHGLASPQPWFGETCSPCAGSRTMVLRTRCARTGQQSMVLRDGLAAVRHGNHGFAPGMRTSRDRNHGSRDSVSTVPPPNHGSCAAANAVTGALQHDAASPTR